jgi:hypothetical protein
MAMEPDGDRPQQPTRVVGADRRPDQTRHPRRDGPAGRDREHRGRDPRDRPARRGGAQPHQAPGEAEGAGPRPGQLTATAAPPQWPRPSTWSRTADTVSGVAERFGLATAEVLACNGLGWSSLIFPGQRLACRCTRPNRRDSSAGSRRTRDRAARRRRRGHRERDRRRLRARRRERAERQRARSSSLIFPGESIVLPIAGDLRGGPPRQRHRALRAPGPPSTGRAVGPDQPVGDAYVVAAATR